VKLERDVWRARRRDNIGRRRENQSLRCEVVGGGGGGRVRGRL